MSCSRFIKLRTLYLTGRTSCCCFSNTASHKRRESWTDESTSENENQIVKSTPSDRTSRNNNTPVEYRERPTALQLFGSDYNLAINWISVVNAVKFTPYGLRTAWETFQWNRLVASQAYKAERAEFLGAELATAHFICHRGGKVRFYGQQQWCAKEEGSNVVPNLPVFFNDRFKVEALDCSKMQIVYEGFDNIRKMEDLRWLSLEGCPYVDDWFLDRVAGEYGHCLQHVNIKDCALVTEKGIASLSRIKGLKSLHLGGHPRAVHLELVCLLLEDVLPELTITGIVYCDKSLLEANRQLHHPNEEADQETLQQQQQA